MAPELYFVMLDSLLDEETFERLLCFVRADKRARIAKQKIRQKAEAMLIGEILAKKVIQERFGVDFNEQKIACTEHGKPYLLNHPEVNFNISHSGNCVVCAVCDVPVGVDVQKIENDRPLVARKVCNEKELVRLEKCSDCTSEFYRLWTQKEAVLKLNGTGIVCGDIKNCLENYNARSKKIEDYWVSVATELDFGDFEIITFEWKLQCARLLDSECKNH